MNVGSEHYDIDTKTQVFLVRYTTKLGSEHVTLRRNICTFPSWWSNVIVSMIDTCDLSWVEPQNVKVKKILQHKTGASLNG